MKVLLVANPWLGLEEADFDQLYLFAVSVLGLFALLLAFRLIGLLRERMRVRKSAWNTFYQLARTRGLNAAQVQTLALVARRARLRSPARLLGSVQLFDRAVDRVAERLELDERQQVLLQSIRKKLLTTKDLWTPATGNRRQWERARCSWNARLGLLAGAEVKKEMLRLGSDSDEHLVQAATYLAENGQMTEYRVQISNISAGGLALLAPLSFEGRSGDIGIISGDSPRLPFDMNGLYIQLCGQEEDAARGLCVLHVRFLPYGAELRRSIIQYVYDKLERAKMRRARKGAAVAGKGTAP